MATEVDVEGSIQDVAEIEWSRSKLRWVLEDCLGELEVVIEEDLGRCVSGIFVGAIVDE
jgi:endoglucanase Acf2